MEDNWIENMNNEKWIDKMKEMFGILCFVCKNDGGSLSVCGFKDCLKACHAECMGMGKSSFVSGGHFTCESHSCFSCHKASEYQCYCCPKEVCKTCNVSGLFANLSETRGLCFNCLKDLQFCENQKEADSKENKMVLKEKPTHKYLYQCWLKLKKNICSEDHHLADKQLKGDDIHPSFSIRSGSNKHGGKRSKGQIALKRTKLRSKKTVFVGWASKPLVDFLVSIGKDTSKEISQLDLAFIIDRYIDENKLIDSQNKRKCVSDERLYTLFKKKSFKKNKVYDLLEIHYRENAEFREEFQQGYSSEEESDSDNTLLAGKRQKKTVNFKEPQEKEMVIEAPLSCFASIIVENIKLVYLNKSVVMALLEEPGTLESMVIGSFVKVKSDPSDYMQKNRYQLVQVTGVKHTSVVEKKEDVVLQVSNRSNDFPISMLSDANFSEEECEDLSERVKSKQLPKLTTVEIEEKAKNLNRFIMKDWIERELARLQNQIDIASEKGKREQLVGYLDRRELLKTEAEQKRLLDEVPKVIAEVLETEPIQNDADQELKKGDEIPPISALHANSGTSDKVVFEDNSTSGNTGSISATYGSGKIKGDEAPSNIQGYCL